MSNPFMPAIHVLRARAEKLKGDEWQDLQRTALVYAADYLWEQGQILADAERVKESPPAVYTREK